ncbi:MAG: phosphatase PAP2 family protein [Solirubrobacteraceae bacterium]|nr:phosphatase PAP2 family protein [Solirubrobacteraceae bacterium]
MSRPTRLTLPKGWRDLVVQFVVLAVAIFVYQLGRGLADGSGDALKFEAISNAKDLVYVERELGLYFEPALQRWSLSVPYLDDLFSWLYLNVQTTVTLAGMLWIYLLHNSRYYFVRNMFFVSFVLACLLYVLVPTAPPRLMPAEYGFHDSVETFSGPRKFVWDAFANPYAAVPSMHIGFAIMIGWSIASLSTTRWVRAFWWSYPAAILFVVVATGNHFWLDAVAGAAVAAIGAVAATGLARLRPHAWAWAPDQPSRVSP